MPIYEFQCGKCGDEFEQLVFKSDETIKCPSCGSKRTKRLLSGFAVTGDARKTSSSCGSCKPSSGGCSGCSCH